MRKSFDSISSTATGKPIQGAQVSLYQADRVTPVIIYSDNASPPTQITEGLFTDAKGYWEFYANSGTYSLKQDNPGEDTKWIDGYEIYDDAEQADGIARSIKVPPGDAVGLLPSAVGRANKYAAFDSSGALIVSDAVGYSQSAGDALANRVAIAENEISDLQSGNGDTRLGYSTWADVVAATGPYGSGTTYSKGQTLVDQDVMWIYINSVAGSGHAPPALPTVSDAYWRQFRNPLDGQMFEVPDTDTGSHADPTNGATVPNAGEHKWTTGVSGTGAHYIYSTDAARAQPFVDAASAQATFAYHLANDDTDTPIPDYPDTTARGAKYWEQLTEAQYDAFLISAQTIADTAAQTLATAQSRAVNVYGLESVADMTQFVSMSVEIDFTTDYYRISAAQRTAPDTLPGTTFSRSGIAYIQKADGSYQQFATNKFRWISDQGGLIENALANGFSHPDDLTNAVWTKSNIGIATGQADPAGGTTATRLTDATAAAFSSINQVITLPANTATRTFSMLMLKEATGAAIMGINMSLTGGTAQAIVIRIRPDTGAIFALSPAVGQNGVISLNVVDAGAFWDIQFVFANQSNTSLSFTIFPAARLNSGGGDDVAAEGSITVWLPQLELGSKRTSPTPGTRGADSLTYAIPDGEDDDVLTVSYVGGSTTMIRSAFGSRTTLDLSASTGGAWVGQKLLSASLVPAKAAIGKTVVTFQGQYASRGNGPATLPVGSSPTITYTGVNTTTRTGTPVLWNDTRIQKTGGTWQTAGSFPDNIFGRNKATTFYSAASTDLNSINGVGAVEFIHTGRYLDWGQKAYVATKVRLWIDGKLSGNPVPQRTGPDSGQNHYWTIDFGSVATRTIRLECIAFPWFFYGVVPDAGDPITAVTTPSYPRALFFGDSFWSGTGASDLSKALEALVGYTMGFRDIVWSGSGGTGWNAVNTNPAFPQTHISFYDRFDTDVLGTPADLYVIEGASVNDGGSDMAQLTARLNEKLTALRAAQPSALIFVVGPQDVSAPSSPSSGYLDLRTATLNALVGINNITFIDMMGVAWSKIGDGLHPNDAGYVQFCAPIIAAIKSRISVS